LILYSNGYIQTILHHASGFQWWWGLSRFVLRQHGIPNIDSHVWSVSEARI